MFTQLFVVVVVPQSANVTAAEVGDVTLNPDLQHYQRLFGILIIVMLVLCVIKCLVYVSVTFHSSTTLHNKLLKEVTPLLLLSSLYYHSSYNRGPECKVMQWR